MPNKLRLLLKSLKPIRIMTNIICFILGAAVTAMTGFLCITLHSKNSPIIVVTIMSFAIFIMLFDNIPSTIIHYLRPPLRTTTEKDTVTAAAIDGFVSLWAGVLFEVVFIIAFATLNPPHLPPIYCIVFLLETIGTGNITYMLLRKNIAKKAISIFSIFAFIFSIFLLSTKPLPLLILFFLLGFPLGCLRENEETK